MTMQHNPECRNYAAANNHSPCICEHLKTAYQRGREDATRAIAEVVHDTIVSKKFVAGGLSDLPDLLTAIYYAGGGEQVATTWVRSPLQSGEVDTATRGGEQG